jgi:hypothetical protein
MRKYARLSAITGFTLGGAFIVIGAWSLVNHQVGANAYFKAGIILVVSSVFWYWVALKSRNRELETFYKASK